MDIQLSISLLASDRAASLERCLDSLRPLLMRIPSELIIVLTGTDERVRQIASQYTDYLIPFKWCNDFSAARNAGLREARGEWFLYIDDDEWFDDTAEICDFFLNGEYKRYGAACYIQRNYLGWDGISHSDFHAFRMAVNTPGIHFINPIHEELTPRLDPCKYFNTYVHHYGYVSESKAYTEKTVRNVSLLLEDIQENPNYIKNYIQLVQEYCTEHDWEKAEKYCRKAYMMRMEKYERNWFQIYLGDIIYAKRDREQAIQEITSILEKEAPCELVRLSFYDKLIALYMGTQDYEKILEYGMRFEKTLRHMDSNPRLWSEQGYGGANESRIKNPHKLYLGRMRCAEAALQLGDIGKASYFSKLLPWDEEYWMQQYYGILDQWKEKYGGLFWKLIETLSYDAPYLLYQKALRMDGGNTDEARQHIFIQCMSETDSLYLKEKILKEALLSEMDLSPFLELLDIEVWKVCAVRIVDGISLQDLSKVKAMAERYAKAFPAFGLWLSKLIGEKELIQGFFSGDALRIALLRYCQSVLQFYHGLYQEELFCEKDRCLLPWDCRFAIFASEGLEHFHKKEFPDAVRKFRSALKYYPGMTGAVHELIRQMTAASAAPAANAEKEFQMLAGQMKETLQNMLDNGQYTEAFSIASQLSPLIPDDLELLRLRQKILRGCPENVT
ncbi:glycosyltransferase [Lachnospiraceae bacterium 29-91]